ncbi:MAG: helix-turn-helix domain-containing protein [Burkholderiales bacterium]
MGRPSISTAAQRDRILQALRTGPKSTIELRGADMDILSPASRVMELRNQGYNIVTTMSREPSASGVLHTVAKYVLMGGGQQRLALRR